MRPINETGPPGETPSQSLSQATDNQQGNTRPPIPTQYDRVLDALMAHDEVCGHRTFYGEMRIPRFSAHLTRARKAGFVITKRPCDRHDHEGTGWLYRLEALPYDLSDPLDPEPLPKRELFLDAGF